MTVNRVTDRSRITAFQRCNRARYWNYEWDGVGLQKIRASVPLATGTYVHAGLADLLRGCDVEDAIGVALEGYEREVRDRGLELEPGEDASYVADEQRAWIEAILRVAAINWLPRFLVDHEVLEVEHEDVWENFAPGIDLMARADALVKEKDTSDLYVVSFKTAAKFDRRTEQGNRHDVQGLSEVAVIERRMAPERILGVKMIYFLKGRREEYPEGSGNWITWSPLIRGWYNEGVTGAEYAFRFQWQGPDTNPDTGKLRVHRLGRGWQKFECFGRDARMSVKEWIELLASGTVQPDAGSPFESEIVEPPAYFRNDQEMQDWVEQTQAQEFYIGQQAAEIDGLRKSNFPLRRHLNEVFPQYRHSCDYPSKCQFQELCFGDDSAIVNPLGTGLYRLRVPHHAPEVDRLDTLAPSSTSRDDSA